MNEENIPNTSIKSWHLNIIQLASVHHLRKLARLWLLSKIRAVNEQLEKDRKQILQNFAEIYLHTQP